MRTMKALILLQLLVCHGAFGQVPDLSGIWVSVPARGAPLEPAALPLTQAAEAKLAAFDPRRLDSTYFCMPFGTPRNMLNTAQRPLKIIQTNAQFTLLFDGLGDVRRVFTDGRAQPEDPIPSWMGHSLGNWNGATLVIDTVAMTSESILTEQGLPHSDSMLLHEEFSLVEETGDSLLQVQLQISDPEYYEEAITATRYFRRAPGAQLSEGSSQCLLDQWRRRLENINREMFRDLQAATTEQEP